MLTAFLMHLINAAAWQDLRTFTYGTVSQYASRATPEEWKHFMRCRARVEHICCYLEVE